ncbi:MAG: nitroreductase family protein [Candidatus Heimdallarchaeota archaeon]
MDMQTVIKTRRAIRVFDVKPIPIDIITKILEAGRLAPSSKNSQPVRMIVIRDKNKLKRISLMTYSGDFIADAPMAIAIITEDAKLPEIDAARAVQNMVLIAWSYGIGSVWVTNFWEKGKELLGVPMTGRYRLITVIPFGYPHPSIIKPRGRRIRLNMKDVAFTEEWGKPWSS